MFNLQLIFGTSILILGGVVVGAWRMFRIRKQMDEHISSGKTSVQSDGRISGETSHEYNLLLRKMTLIGSLTMFGLCASCILFSIGLSCIGLSRLGIILTSLAIFFVYFCGGSTVGMVASGIWNVSPIGIPVGLLLGPIFVGSIFGAFLFGALIGMLIGGALSGPLIGSIDLGNQGKPLVNAVMKSSKPIFKIEGSKYEATFSNSRDNSGNSEKMKPENDNTNTSSRLIDEIIKNAPIITSPLIGSIKVQNDGAPLIKITMRDNKAETAMNNNTARTIIDKDCEFLKDENIQADLKKEITKKDPTNLGIKPSDILADDHIKKKAVFLKSIDLLEASDSTQSQKDCD